MTDKEFAGWKAITESSRDHWTEDTIFRLNERGAMYFISGEDGAYMRIGKDGTLEAGSYEGAIPHIGEAFFEPLRTEHFADYNAAFVRTLELGGKKFLVDMFSAPDQNAIVQAAWAKVDAEKAAKDSGYTSVLGAIEKAKSEPKPPRREQAIGKNKNRSGDEL